MKENNLINPDKMIIERYLAEYKNSVNNVWAYTHYMVSVDLEDTDTIIKNYILVANLDKFQIRNNLCLGKNPKITLSDIQVAIELKFVEDELKSIRVCNLNSTIKNLRELDYLKVTDILNKADELFKHDFVIYGENIEMSEADYPIYCYPIDRVDKCLEIITLSSIVKKPKELEIFISFNKCMFLPSCEKGDEK